MKQDRNFSGHDETNQVVLSHELLNLLQWMVTNEAPRFKKMIKKALSTGLRNKIYHPEFTDNHNQKDVQYGIIEFFSLLESLMLEAVNEQTIQAALEKNLMPAIDQIDGTICDDETVRTSVVRTTSMLENHPNKNPQEALFKELLKQWQPSKKKIFN